MTDPSDARSRTLARRRLRTQRTQRAPITLDDVVEAAFRLVDKDGIEKLTMRKLADELGIQAASLYWHVKDKDELIDLLAEVLFADMDLSKIEESPSWRDNLWRFAHAFRAHLAGRRDSAQILANRFVLGPHVLTHLERLLGWLRQSGLDDQSVVYALYDTMVFVHGFVLWETAPMSAQVARGEPVQSYLEAVRVEIQELSDQDFPHTVALAGLLTGPSNDDRFEFGLDCLLTGMSARIRH
jgi:TetR/AcrR family tetracycline transcriptional repressor